MLRSVKEGLVIILQVLSLHPQMGRFDKKILNFPIFMFSWSQSLHIWKIQWVFCLIFPSIKTKTHFVASTLKILKKKNNPSTEKIYASYESANTPPFWDGRKRVWHYHGCAMPTSCKFFATFPFCGCGGQIRLMK